MDFSKLSQSFTVKEQENVLYLKPKKDEGIEYINITFKDNIISKIDSKDNNGNLTTITLSNVVLDKKINDASFKKKLPKDVNIFKQ